MKNNLRDRSSLVTRNAISLVILFFLNGWLFGQAARTPPSTATAAGPAASGQKAPTPIAMPMGRSVLSKNVIAVVIGNQTYERGTSAVTYALNDARVFRDALLKIFGIDANDIFYYENAGLSDMYSLFGTANEFSKSRICRTALLRDTPPDLIVYYSGHGAPATTGQEKGKGFLVPVDADVMAIQNTGYAIDTLIANIEAMKSKGLINRSWISFDACFSGQSGDGKLMVKNVSGLAIVPVVPKSLPKSSVLMFASSGEEFASWHTEEKHGLFTYFLLKALSGEADADGNGMLGISEIASYMRKWVPRYASGLNGQEQTPQVLAGGEMLGFLALGKKEGEFIPVVPTGKIEFTSLPPDAQISIDGQAIDLDPSQNTTPDLPPGSYKVKVVAAYTRDFAETVAVAGGRTVPVAVARSFGILELKIPAPGIVAEVSSDRGAIADAAAPQHYELDEGDYVVKARLSDDIDWSWKARVRVSIGSTTQLAISKEAGERSLAWQIQEEGKNADGLNARYDQAIEKKRRIRPFTISSLAAGGVSALGAGLFMILGNSAMDSYNGSTTQQEAEEWRSKVEIYDVLTIASAALSAVGLGTGGVLLAIAPKPAALEAQVNASLDRLRELKARKVVQEIK